MKKTNQNLITVLLLLLVIPNKIITAARAIKGKEKRLSKYQLQQEYEKKVQKTHWTDLQKSTQNSSNGFEVMQKLIEQDHVDINEPGRYGNTALLQLLVDLKRTVGDNFQQKLYLESKGLNTQENPIYEQIDYLIDKGANPNIENLKGETALGLALVYAQWYIVLSLLQAGAGVNYLNINKETPLDYLQDHELYMTMRLSNKNEYDKRISFLKNIGAQSGTVLDPLASILLWFMDYI